MRLFGANAPVLATLPTIPIKSPGEFAPTKSVILEPILSKKNKTTDAPTCLTSYNKQKRQPQCATGACFHGINCYEAFWYDLQRIKAAIKLVSPIMNY